MTRAQCSEADIDRYLKILLAERRLSEDRFEPVAHIEDRQPEDNPLDPVHLDSLKIGDGVNALKPGTQIDFAPRVTVVFGENGSGKSGFVRALKRAAGVRTAEDILPDVWKGKRVSPSATFVVTVGESTRVVEWKNEFGSSPLKRASVFDTRGARLHIEEDLTYVYTPGELTLFPLVQTAIERVRAELDRAITARTPGPNTLLASFNHASSIYPIIETLDAKTDIEEVRRYALLPEGIESTIETLNTEIMALRSSNTHDELKRAQNRRALVEMLREAIETARAFDLRRYAQLVGAYEQAKKHRDEAGAKVLDGLGIPGVLSNEWRNFIQSGEDYIRKHLGDGYPHAEDSCAYCRQPLSTSAFQLITKYRDFMNNEIRVAVDKAESELREYGASLTGLDLSALQERLNGEISNSDDDVLVSVRSATDKIKLVAESVTTSSQVTWPDKDAVLLAAERILTTDVDRLTELVTSLQTSADERDAEIKKKQRELVELEAKGITKSLFPQIEKRVIDAKWVLRASTVRNGISTVLRTLTDTAKQAGEEILNKGFEKRFREECHKLRAPDVTLNFPGRQGQVTRRKTIAATYQPSRILSEGEQKALALADFLAEVMALPVSSPVIFDDPITSMDYRRVKEVAARIVALAEVHQVIVFTHSIWFAAELLARADKKTWRYYDIRSEGVEKGLVSAAAHPRVDSVKHSQKRIGSLINTAEKAEDDVRAALVEKGYEELRGLCELIVEYELLKGVVRRYEPNVMMTMLEKINVAELGNSIAVVVPVFDKACRYIASHSQPIETQGIRPTLEELKKDFEAVTKTRGPHKEG